MRKVLVSLLCVMMLVTFMPTMAWADSNPSCDGGEACDHEAAIGTTHYDTLKEALDAATSGSEIKVLRDISLDEENDGYQITENLTLDINDQTITDNRDSKGKGAAFLLTGDSQSISAVIKNGKIKSVNGKNPVISVGNQSLTAEDLEIESENTDGITFNNAKALKVSDSIITCGGSCISYDAKVDMTGMSIDLEDSVFTGAKGDAKVLNLGNSMYDCIYTANITGCEIKRNDADQEDLIFLRQDDEERAVTFSNNTITAETGNAVFVNFNTRGKVIFEDNVIDGKIKLTQAQNYPTIVNSGSFKLESPFECIVGNENEANFKVYGGYFKSNTDSVLLKAIESAGSNIVENTDSNKDEYGYKVIYNGWAAQVGDKFFKTYEEALAAAKSTQAQIILYADVTADELYPNLNGNGHEFSFPGSKEDLLKENVQILNTTLVCGSDTIKNASVQKGRFSAGNGEDNEEIAKFLENHLAEGYLMHSENKNIRPKSEFQAMIDGKIGYTHLDNAVSAATKKDAESVYKETITVLKEPTSTTGQIMIYDPYSAFILDLAGFTFEAGDSRDVAIGITVHSLFGKSADNADITIKNGTVIGRTFGIASNGTLENVKLTLENVNVVAKGEDGVGIYFPSKGESLMTISGGSVKGDTGIGIKGGSVTISDGARITAVGEKKIPAESLSSGINSTGDAIYVEGGYDSAIKVELKDGIFISEKADAVNMLFNDNQETPDAQKMEISVSGGTYSNAPKDYIEEGLLAINVANGSDELAHVGAAADSALKDVKSGDTVTVVGTAANQQITIPVDGVVVKNESGEPVTVVDKNGEQHTVTEGSSVQTGQESGGTAIPSIVQKPTIETDDHVTVTLSLLGTTATISVEDGYQLEDVLLNGTSLGKVNVVNNLKTGDKLTVITSKKPTDEEIQEAARLERIKKGVENTKLVARSKAYKGKTIITWTKSWGYKVDGYNVYKSKKRNAGYVFMGKTKKMYMYHTKNLKKGTRYYYQVKGYRTVGGEKVYTKLSLKAIRTAK